MIKNINFNKQPQYCNINLSKITRKKSKQQIESSDPADKGIFRKELSTINAFKENL